MPFFQLVKHNYISVDKCIRGPISTSHFSIALRTLSLTPLDSMAQMQLCHVAGKTKIADYSQ